MQTFLPYDDFTTTAKVLDRQRLGKQRVEGLQLLRALSGVTKGWVNHPAAKMWRGHEYVLFTYTVAICDEWIRRGYNDTCLEKSSALAFEHAGSWGRSRPEWLGDRALHQSHRSNLVRKMPEHYGALWPGLSPDLPYVWPVS